MPLSFKLQLCITLAGPLLASKVSKVLRVKLCHLYGISMHTPLPPMSFILHANFGGGWTSLSSFRATSCLARSHPIVCCHFRCAWSSPMVILNPVPSLVTLGLIVFLFSALSSFWWGHFLHCGVARSVLIPLPWCTSTFLPNLVVIGPALFQF